MHTPHFPPPPAYRLARALTPALAALALTSGAALAAVPDAERQALVNFYNGLDKGEIYTWCNALGGWDLDEDGNQICPFDDDFGIGGWPIGDPCEGEWPGVTCNSEKTHVTALYIHTSKFHDGDPAVAGQLADLSALQELERLSVSAPDGLHGSIDWLENLKKLQEAYLGGNFFTGRLPDFSKMPALRVFSANNGKRSYYLSEYNYNYNYNHNIISSSLSGALPDPGALEQASLNGHHALEIPALAGELREKWLKVLNGYSYAHNYRSVLDAWNFWEGNYDDVFLRYDLDDSNTYGRAYRGDRGRGTLSCTPEYIPYKGASAADFAVDSGAAAFPVAEGEVSCVAKPAEGYVLRSCEFSALPLYRNGLGNLEWSRTPEIYARGNRCSGTVMTAPGPGVIPGYVSAIFRQVAPDEYVITVADVPGGELYCQDAAVKRLEGTTCDVVPNDGYSFSGALLVDGAADASCDGAHCTISNVSSNVTLTGVFEQLPTSQPDEGGSGSGSDPDAGAGSGDDPGAGSDSGRRRRHSAPAVGELGLLLSGIALAGAAAPALRRREKRGKKANTRQ